MFKNWWEDLKRIPYLDTQWAAVWVMIYISFLLMDIVLPGWPPTNLIKYVGIFLCVVYAYTKHHNDIMLTMALLLTFLADTILVWTNWLITGVCIFSLAQFMHFLRLSRAKVKYIFARATIVILAFSVTIICGLKPIYAIGSIYAITLISNLCLSTVRYHERRNDFRARCAFYGFVAFLCCDCCVALRFFALDDILPLNILPIVNFLVWFFYYPSQVLIANSSTMPEIHKTAKSLRK